MIKLIVDSTTDLPREYFEQYDINMVPLIVNINNQEFKDKVTISVDELYQSLRKDADVKTSQPAPSDIYDAIIKQVENHHDVIFITISSILSGTYQTVYMIAQELIAEYPDTHIEVIDSKGGSAISGLMALQAGRLIERNIAFDEIVTVLNDMALHCEHIFSVDDLKYLFKSGRLSRATALIGNLLHVKPILHVENGEIKLLMKVRGTSKALNTIIDLVEERISNFPDQIIGIMHADDYEIALNVKRRLIERIGEKEIIIDQIGSTLGSHIGISGVGVFFFNKKPNYYIK